jgi:hypothetical protein
MMRVNSNNNQKWGYLMVKNNKTSSFPWGKFSIAFGFVALFACGLAVGLFMNTNNNKPVRAPSDDTRAVVARPNAQNEGPGQKPCELAEATLTRGLKYYNEQSTEVMDHLERAEIFARASEYGCAENSEKYRQMALREIGVARSLNNQKFKSDVTQQVINTYKKEDMKRDADKILDKARQITDPAIDFILEVEKIINDAN